MSDVATEVEAIVRGAQLGPEVHVSGYRVVEIEVVTIVGVVLVLDAADWDDEAVAKCETASDNLSDAARGSEHPLSFFCRPTSEQAEFADAEAGLWAPMEFGHRL